MKRVILIVIDALTGPLLQQEIENGRYPHFQQLQAAGDLREQCTSIFPSITHAALTSIATGKYPVDHGVVGSHWYDLDGEKVVYFSGSPEMVWKKGMGNFVREFLLELNHTYLQAPTIFQQLERQGFETASINFPLYRGDVAHEVTLPTLLKWIQGLPENATLKGPRHLILGDLLPSLQGIAVEASLSGLAHWFGFRDENTIDLLLQLADRDKFADFTLAYFPENDYRAHDSGPAEAHKHLFDLDALLGSLFEIYGGLDVFLEQFAIVIVGDHSQSETAVDEAEEAINLEEVLHEYQLAEAGQPWCEDDEIMPCPNLRASQLYLKEATPTRIKAIADQLLTEPRMDQVLYRAALTEEGDGYVVRSENGRLRFWRTAGGGRAHDRYGNAWQWEGDLEVVDGQMNEDMIHFPDYPNAFERIAGALDAATSGQIWSTAKLNHEIMVPHIKLYTGGGSHASLHREDSQPPLLTAGIPDHVTVPTHPRIVDVAGICRACLQP